MENCIKAIDSYLKLSEENKNLLIPDLEPLELKKGKTLIHELEVSKYIYFIEKGVVKTYFIDQEGNKNVVWFGFEGDTFFSFCAYFNTAYHHETIELIEDCLFYRINVHFFKQLFNTNLEWANWGRCFAEYHLVKVYTENDEHKSLNAKERYFNLIEKNKELVKRVPLKDIASYLGISPISVSRFRKEQL